MGEQPPRVEVHGVAADRHDHGDPEVLERLAEVGRRADPVAQVVVRDRLGEALGDRLEVAAGEPAVGREALGEDEQVAERLRERVVVARQPAADVAERVLLRAHRHAVGERRHLADDVGDVARRAGPPRAPG